MEFAYEYYFCRLIVLESCFQRKLVQDRTEVIPPLINSRGMELAVIKVGGFGLGGITNEVTYFLASSGKWRHLTSIPHVEQCNFGTAVLENELYVVGGCFNQSLQVRNKTSPYSLSSKTNKKIFFRKIFTLLAFVTAHKPINGARWHQCNEKDVDFH